MPQYQPRIRIVATVSNRFTIQLSKNHSLTRVLINGEPSSNYFENVLEMVLQEGDRGSIK